MKLTKISLAALVALGAFSSVASATPLEEAIKNVDLSGFARYRYTNDKRTGEYSNTKTESGSKAGHGFKICDHFKTMTITIVSSIFFKNVFLFLIILMRMSISISCKS